MATTQASAKYDHHKSPVETRQTPQGQTSGQGLLEQSSELSPPLHRHLGNSYVQAMTTKTQRLGIQAKLKVNEPEDIYEREADRVANKVVAAPTHANISNAPLQIQRFSGQSHGQVDAAPASVDQTLASPGRPLEPTLRQDMEQRFGHDFSRVRVHTGAAAEQSARDVNAHAYTLGHNIVFDAGRFAPGTTEGRRLIAHELTHVIQQAGRGMPFIQRKEKEDQHNTTTVTQITVEAKTTGEGRGRALTSDGATYQINIEVNNLSPGRVTTGKPLGEPDSDGWSRIHLGSKGANQFVYLLPPGVTAAPTMTIIVEPSREQQARDEIKALPPRIQDFLTSGKRNLSGEDLLKAASAGQILKRYGVTEDELLLQQQRRIDRQEVGLQQAEYANLEDWALSYVGFREQARAAEQANATTLLRATERLSLASLNLYQQDPLLEIVDPQSRISALATHTAIHFKETRPMRGPREKVETPFSDLGDLRTTLQTFENALVADLRALATSFLDDTEARLIQVQHQFMRRGGKHWGPGYLEDEIEKVKNDPDVIKVQKEHEELTQAIDQEQQEDDQNYRKAGHVRQWADLYDKRKKERQDKREKEQQRYKDALRQTVARKSMLKLPPGSDVDAILSANSGRRAQVMLSDAIVDGRVKVREAREKLSEPKFLYAADIVINKEKEFLSQALAAGSDYNRYQEGTLEHAFGKGFAAKQWNTINWIIDKLASERKAQTTIWQDIVKVFEYVSMFIPGPIGWAARFVGAAARFDQDISAARNQDVSYSTGMSSVPRDPNAASSALGEAAFSVFTDSPFSRAATGATQLTLRLEKNLAGEAARLGEQGVATAGKRELTQVGDEAANLGKPGVATPPGKRETKPPVPPNAPQQPQGVIYAATGTGHVVPISVNKGSRQHQLSERVPGSGGGAPPPGRGTRTPGSVQPSTTPAPPPPQRPSAPPPRGRDFDDEPTLVDLEPAGGASRGSATPSGGGPSQVPDTVHGEITTTEFTRPPAGASQGPTHRVHPHVIPRTELSQRRGTTPSRRGSADEPTDPEALPFGASRDFDDIPTTEFTRPPAGASRGATQRVQPHVIPRTQLPKFQEAQKELQPLVDQINPCGGTMNCVPVTIATDLSLAQAKAFKTPVILDYRNVEVVATRTGPLPVLQVEERAFPRRVLEAYVGARMETSGARGLFEELRRAGHGARAIVTTPGEQVGHAYNVINWRGMLIAVDGQSRTIRPFADIFAQLEKANDDWRLRWYRTN